MEFSEHRKRLREDGFTRFEGFLAGEELERLQAVAQAVIDGLPADHRERYKSNGTLENFADHAEFADIAANPRAFDVLAGLGASDPRWLAGYLISKPPGGPPLFWHQDWWGWEEPVSYTDEAVQLFFMYYLVDTGPENGCLRVIPGSHRNWHPLHDLTAAHNEDLARVKDPDSPAFQSHPDEYAVRVKAGDLLVGDARLLHSAYANTSQAERPLLTLWYVPNFSQLSDPVRARYRSIYAREGLDIDDADADYTTVDDWPDAQFDKVREIVPTYSGETAPLPWNRSPRRDRLVTAR